MPDRGTAFARAILCLSCSSFTAAALSDRRYGTHTSNSRIELPQEHAMHRACPGPPPSHLKGQPQYLLGRSSVLRAARPPHCRCLLPLFQCARVCGGHTGFWCPRRRYHRGCSHHFSCSCSTIDWPTTDTSFKSITCIQPLIVCVPADEVAVHSDLPRGAPCLVDAVHDNICTCLLPAVQTHGFQAGGATTSIHL